jgi:hypothetical protein
MPALNFKKQFADAVESGQKRQTIRGYRKDSRNPQPGQTLFLFTGLRSKYCRRLGEAECKNVTKLHIGEHFAVVKGVHSLGVEDIETFAKADGFNNSGEFFDFFKQNHGLPFYGLLIEW